MGKQVKQLYEFGPFRVDVVERLLLRESAPVPLPPKAFDTLLVLVRNSGHLLTKDELLKTVWPDTFVEENNLTQYVSAIRKVLGSGSNGQQYIETVPRIGYRFVARVKEVWDEDADLLVEEHTQYRVLIKEEEHEEEAECGDTVTRRPGLSLFPPASLRQRAVVFTVAASILLISLAAVFLIVNKGNKTENGEGARPAVRSIAVLPFKPLGPEGGVEEYIRIGMADALVTRLGKIEQLTVRPTSAIQKYMDLNQNPVAAGRELRVDSVLEGRIQKSEERVRVTMQLVQVQDGVSLWTEKFDAKFTDILTVQDRISDQVARVMTLRLTAREKEQLNKHGTGDSEAYQAYLKGRYFWNKRTSEGFKKAIEYFQQAIASDPSYAAAYSGLADCYNLSSEYEGFPPKEAFPRAREAATKALELDETLAEAHVSLAYTLTNYEWDWAGAEREFKRAIELNPNYATAHQWYGEFLMAMGRFDEARAALKRAQEIDPISPIINAEQGLPFYYARHYDQAIEQFHKALEIVPEFVPLRHYLYSAYIQKGMGEEALAEAIIIRNLTGASPEAIAALKEAYAESGIKGISHHEFAKFKERLRYTYVSPYSIAGYYARFGDKDQTFAWLERAYQERDRFLIFLKVDFWDNIRSDPRFTDLLRRMKLAP